MGFEWDDKKEAANLVKHGISFREAAQVWRDPKAMLARDDRRDYGEERLRVTGAIGGEILLVVFTPRGEKIRLISARRANAKERKRYRDH